MHTGKGQVVELILESGLRYARISCAGKLIPSPGQYLLAGTASSSDLLPVSLFSTESTPESFTASAPFPEMWMPGTEIYLRGPLGRGFVLPTSARNIALIAFDVSPSRLLGLIQPALKQGASIVLVCETNEDNLPDAVEIQPLSTLNDVFAWANYVAFDVPRENLFEMRERMIGVDQMSLKAEAQVLIHTSMPCGGVAECGVCTVRTKSNGKLACKDGPVFDLREIV